LARSLSPLALSSVFDRSGCGESYRKPLKRRRKPLRVDVAENRGRVCCGLPKFVVAIAVDKIHDGAATIEKAVIICVPTCLRLIPS
jgi:hypothetical protein